MKQSKSAVERRTGMDPLSSEGGFMIEMSDIGLSTSALQRGIFDFPSESNATVVSTQSTQYSEDSPTPVRTVIIPRSSKKRGTSSATGRRRSLLSKLPLEEAVALPIPEFLFHLYSMLQNPSYSDLISWSVPSQDEPDHMGGGIKGIGKIDVHKPEVLQDYVLGKFFRHSHYASFQRQLNYFGFKKRLHDGKKGKLDPCSYIHDLLTKDVSSVLTLKRRPPARKHPLERKDTASTKDVKVTSALKRSPPMERKSKTSKKAKQDKMPEVISSKPIQVQSGEYGPPLNERFTAIESSLEAMRKVHEPSLTFSQAVSERQSSKSEGSGAETSVMELLCTSLPPAEILFSDDVDSVDDEGMPAWLTGDGKYHYHNVDSALVDLAMLY